MKTFMTFLLVIILASLFATERQYLVTSENFEPYALTEDSILERELRLVKYTQKNWQNNSWQNSISVDFFYNNAGLVEKYMIYVWTGTTWMLDHRELLTYDQNQNITEVLIETLNGGIWSAVLLYQISYNVNNDMTELLLQFWDAGWINDSRITYIYDDLDQNIETLYQYWSVDEWVNDMHILYTYDAQGDAVEGLQQVWIIDEWQNDVLTLNEYEDHNLMEALYQVYFMDEWVNDLYLNYEYNVNDDIIYQLLEVWESDEWCNEKQDSLFYDDEYNILSQLTQNWDQADSLWVNSALTEYLYEEVKVQNDAVPVCSIQLYNYPNPFNPITEIRFQNLDSSQMKNVKIEIYNLKGQKVKVLEVRNNEHLNNQGLSGNGSVTWNGKDDQNNSVASGFYFYNLKVKDKVLASSKCLLLK